MEWLWSPTSKLALRGLSWVISNTPVQHIPAPGLPNKFKFQSLFALSIGFREQQQRGFGWEELGRWWWGVLVHLVPGILHCCWCDRTQGAAAAPAVLSGAARWIRSWALLNRALFTPWVCFSWQSMLGPGGTKGLRPEAGELQCAFSSVPV